MFGLLHVPSTGDEWSMTIRVRKAAEGSPLPPENVARSRAAHSKLCNCALGTRLETRAALPTRPTAAVGHGEAVVRFLSGE